MSALRLRRMLLGQQDQTMVCEQDVRRHSCAGTKALWSISLIQSIHLYKVFCLKSFKALQHHRPHVLPKNRLNHLSASPGMAERISMAQLTVGVHLDPEGPFAFCSGFLFL